MIEIIFITALFAVIGTGIVSTLLSGSHASKQGGDYVVASGYIGEAINAVKSIRDQAWNTMINGTYGLSTVGAKFSFNGVSESMPGGYTRTVTVSDVYRTGSLTGDIAPSGVLDTGTKKISINVVWNIFATQMKSLTSIFYVTNWKSLAWVQTLFAEFGIGSSNSSTSTNSIDGEVTLASTNADWTGITQEYSVDQNGTGNLIASAFDESHNWLVTLQATTSGNELQVLDVSNISNATPTVLRGMELTQGADLVVSGDFAYVTASDTGSSGAEIVVVNLLTMSTVATVNLPQSAAGTAIVMNGTTLVVGRVNNANTEEVFFYNVSNPASPALIGSTELGFSVTDLAMNAQNVFVTSATNTAEMTVINVSTRTISQTIDMTTTADALSVLVSGTNIYIGRASGTSEELVMLDGSNPPLGLPILFSLEIGSDVNGIAMDPKATMLTLATNDNSGELVLVNTSDVSIAQVVNVAGSNNANTSAIYGTHVYLGSDADAAELVVYGVLNTGWNNPQVLGTANQSSPRPGTTVFVSGNYAYVGTTKGSSKPEFTIYDISQPTLPVYVGSYMVGDTVNRILVSGNYAYLAVANNALEFQIIDITNKSAPTLLSSLNLAGSQSGNVLAISGTTLYIARDSGSNPELYSINVSNPATPIILGSLNLTGTILDIGIYSTRLYAGSTGNSNELNIVDISNPSSLSLITTYNAAGSQDGSAISLF
ncbi:MAG: hypothetical protein AAB664_00865, partial [Patescibacteria group bacterium]